MGHIMQTGSWLSVSPSIVNETELGAQEWRGSIFLCYDIELPKLPDHCDGRGTAFDTCHTFEYKKGGVITACHNKLYGGVADLVRNVFTPMHVHDIPKIYTGRIEY